MHLMSCEHPKRVYNKYIDKYLWVPCGFCNTCRNRKASHYVELLEKERRNSAYCFFVTLTYDNYNLPVYTLGLDFDYDIDLSDYSNQVFQSSRSRDVECIPFSKFNLDKTECLPDFELFKSLLISFGGIPYASRTDIQLFNKRLNKYFFQNVSNKYQNFRYFVVSEYGSTTLRPHFHAVYFSNDSNVARRFSEAVLSCWRFGRSDTQFVEKSACSYVAQYINKSDNLPSFYSKGALSPFFLCSRKPFIGNLSESSQSDEEIFDKCLTEVYHRKKDSFQLDNVGLDKSCENRLFPKCPSFSQVSSSLRVELYSAVCRFPSKSFEEFREKVNRYLYDIYDYKCSWFTHCHFASDFSDFLNKNYYEKVLTGGDELSTAVNWLRRLYYLSRHVCRFALKFGVSVLSYVNKIVEYYDKKELYLLKKFFAFQEDYTSKNNSEDLLLMYPEFMYDNNYTYSELLNENIPKDVSSMIQDNAFRAYSNKKTHFKNAYLDSVHDKQTNQYLFNSLKRFYHAKKCNETLKTLAT